jgi:2-oxoglutarate ferredoxin oxidoreductase subunit alpha
VAEVEPGGYLFYDSTRPLPPAPSATTSTSSACRSPRSATPPTTDPRQRTLFKNIMVRGRAVGADGHRARGDREAVRRAVQGQGTAARSNVRRCTWAATSPRTTWTAAGHGLKVRRADKVGERIFVDGNTAAALGCVYGGATVCAWYPITPSVRRWPRPSRSTASKYRIDPETGENRYAIVQAEDEIASIGMVTSARLERRARLHRHLGPRRVADDRVHRPGLLRRDPGDHHQRAARRPVHRHAHAHPAGRPAQPAPTRRTATPSTCCCCRRTRRVLRARAAALDLADRLQTPVFVMTDLDIGMNQRLCEPFEWDDSRALRPRQGDDRRGAGAGKDFGRYKDVDGDGIPWRTCPARTPARALLHPRHHAQPLRALFRGGPDYIYNVQRLLKKFATAATLVPQPVLRRRTKTPLGVIYFGSTSAGDGRGAGRAGRRRHPPRRDAAAGLPVPEAGARVHRLRTTTSSWSSRTATRRCAAADQRTGVDPAWLIKVLHYDGTPITARFITRPSPSMCTRWPCRRRREGGLTS